MAQFKQDCDPSSGELMLRALLLAVERGCDMVLFFSSHDEDGDAMLMHMDRLTPAGLDTIEQILDASAKAPGRRPRNP